MGGPAASAVPGATAAVMSGPSASPAASPPAPSATPAPSGTGDPGTDPDASQPASGGPGAATTPDSVSTGFPPLDRALATYLSNLGNQVGASVYDVTNDHWYGYNTNVQFITASSVKVAIMIALLRRVEAQGRRPNSTEMARLTAMIEHSDNDAASALYAEVGDQAGMQRFASQVGLSGFYPANSHTRGWGWSTISPSAMVRLLKKLWQHKVLSDVDRALALKLMSHIESDQRTGVGTTAPAGAFVAMKNGWVPGPDGLWVMNSSGIVSTSTDTYIISVYTAHNSSLGQGQRIVVHVCGVVATRLD